MATNFEKVLDFNQSFGVTVHESPKSDIFDTDPKLVNLRMNLIREEMRELEDAVKQKNMTECVDALGDILYVVYGMGVSFGVNMDEAFRLIHESNMSKLCISEEEAINTVKWYENEFKENRQPYDSPGYRKSTDGKYWVVYNKSSGKILKSINYAIVDLRPVLNMPVKY